jgi:hypothetical protein
MCMQRNGYSFTVFLGEPDFYWFDWLKTATDWVDSSMSKRHVFLQGQLTAQVGERLWKALYVENGGLKALGQIWILSKSFCPCCVVVIMPLKTVRSSQIFDVRCTLPVTLPERAFQWRNTQKWSESSLYPMTGPQWHKVYLVSEIMPGVWRMCVQTMIAEENILRGTIDGKGTPGFQFCTSHNGR